MRSDDDGDKVELHPLNCDGCKKRIGWSDQKLNGNVVALPTLPIFLCEQCMMHPERIKI